jgi:hypothetical protein
VRKHPAKGIVRRNAVGKGKKSAQPGKFRVPKLFHRNPVIGPTDDGTDGDDKHIEQGMGFIPVDAWIIDMGEMGLNAGRWESKHTRSSWSFASILCLPPSYPIGIGVVMRWAPHGFICDCPVLEDDQARDIYCMYLLIDKI